MCLSRKPALRNCVRLVMAALLLVGLALSSFLSTGHISPVHASTAQVELRAPLPQQHAGADVAGLESDRHAHACCASEEAVPTCPAACAAVACATPILPGTHIALRLHALSTNQPTAMPSLRSREPELDTPPPKPWL